MRHDVGWPKREYNGLVPTEFARALKGRSKRIFDHEIGGTSETYKELIKFVPPGGTWRDIPPYLLPDRFRGMRRTDSTNLLGRLDPEHPAYTITTQFSNVTAGCFTHPHEDRSLSVREGARLQTFPDTYRFVGSMTSRCAQIGNAVPPLLAEALAWSVAEALTGGTRLRKHVAATRKTKVDPPTAETRARMRRQRRHDTAAEVLVQEAVRKLGLEFVVNSKPLAELRRTADLVFETAQVAVFVDGCFWHGCPKHSRDTKSNTTWWNEKIEKNCARDRQTSRKLREAGWAVIRVWEHENPNRAASRVASAVCRRQERAAAPEATATTSAQHAR